MIYENYPAVYYVGGPLDGHTADPGGETQGYLTAYRDADGQHVSNSTGDRNCWPVRNNFKRNQDRKVRGMYFKQTLTLDLPLPAIYIPRGQTHYFWTLDYPEIARMAGDERYTSKDVQWRS